MVTNKCLKILSRGGIIIYPTDTVYGIGCDATNINSILKINKIKKREPNTPLICLMDGLEMVKKYVLMFLTYHWIIYLTLMTQQQ